MGYVTIDFDLDEFDDDDIFNEFEERLDQEYKNLSEKDLRKLIQVSKKLSRLLNNKTENYPLSKSLEDELKLDLLKNAFKNYSLTEIEEKLK